MQYDLPDDDALRPSALYCPCHSLMGISKTQKSVAGYVVIWIEKCNFYWSCPLFMFIPGFQKLALSGNCEVSGLDCKIGSFLGQLC